MEEKIDSINTKLTQVVDAILGNPLTKQGGFVHDIEILKQKIEDLEKVVQTMQLKKEDIEILKEFSNISWSIYQRTIWICNI